MLEAGIVDAFTMNVLGGARSGSSSYERRNKEWLQAVAAEFSLSRKMSWRLSDFASLFREATWLRAVVSQVLHAECRRQWHPGRAM